MNEAVVPLTNGGGVRGAASPNLKSRIAARNEVSLRWATRAETSSSRTNALRATSSPSSPSPPSAFQRRQQTRQQNAQEPQARSPTTSDQISIEERRSGISSVASLGNKVHQFWSSIPTAMASYEEKQRQNRRRIRLSTVDFGNANKPINRSELGLPADHLSPTNDEGGCSSNHTGDSDKHDCTPPNSKLTASPMHHPTHDQYLPRAYESKGTLTRPTKKSTTPLQNKTELANTLTNIKITSHLHSHLEAITNGHSSHYLKSVLRILPHGFDETSACTSSVQTRKRAFFLLDLARVIRSHALFLSVTCGFGGMDIFAGGPGGSGGDIGGIGGSSSKKEAKKETKIKNVIWIKPQFQVTKNPNLELLKLLIRLGVTLRCNSSDDVLVASRALMEERSERSPSPPTISCHRVSNNTCDEEEQDATGSFSSVGADKNTNYDDKTHYQQQGRDADRNMMDTPCVVEDDSVIMDDVANVRKPDGYFRRLLRARRATTSPRPLMGRQTSQLHRPLRRQYFEVAVDGVDEVRRISNTVRRISSPCFSHTLNGEKGKGGDQYRHSDIDSSPSSEQIPDERCRFMLRLPVVTRGHDTADNVEDLMQGVMKDGMLEKLVLSVHAAAIKEGGELGGASVDLSPWSKVLGDNDIDDKAMRKETYSYLTSVCVRLRLVRLLLLSVNQYHIRIDLTGLPDNIISSHTESLTHALTSIVSRDVTRTELAQLRDRLTSGDSWNGAFTTALDQICNSANDAESSSLVYTADVSELLVARAGALCARIIGVKSQSDKRNMTTAMGQHDVDETVGSVERKKKQDEIDCVSIHYYIDDGCYGSLGSSQCSATSYASLCDTALKDTVCGTIATCREHLPEPLYGNKPLKRAPSHLALKERSPRQIQVQDASNYVKATVWGPTCDGLDRVCESVLLPNDLAANRDWLMFRNLGCGGFGGGLGLGTAFNGFDPPDVDYCALPRSTT